MRRGGVHEDPNSCSVRYYTTRGCDCRQVIAGQQRRSQVAGRRGTRTLRRDNKEGWRL